MSSAGDAAREWERPDDPDISGLITEDDEPVDNFGSEKHQRLFPAALYSSWVPPGGVPFLAAANVGIYASPKQTAVVPDVFVSLDVKVAEDWWQKKNRCYLVWEFGKAPEFALEIVSDRDGTELSAKLRKYQRLGVSYYVVYDPSGQLSDQELHCFELRGGEYVLLDEPVFARLNLGLTFWEGTFEGFHARWLRFTDGAQTLLLTGEERAAQANERAAQANERAAQANERAAQANEQTAQERARADKLAAKLRALGIDPDE